MEDKLKNILQPLIKVNFQFSPADLMHIKISMSDLTKDWNIEDIVKNINKRFPWAMIYDKKQTHYWITLC